MSNTISIPLGLRGRFRLDAVILDAEGNVKSSRTLLPWFDNLITNGGLDLLGSTGGDNLTYCRIGTGSSAPADTDTGLGAQVGYSGSEPTSREYGLSLDGTYVYRRVVRRFAAGTINGVNLAEVGMASSPTGQIFSRALLKDAEGNPTTLTLTAEEVLDVSYELRAYLPAQDTTMNSTIDGVETVVTMRYSTHTTALTNWAHALGNRIVNLPASGSIYCSYYTASTLPSAADAPVRGREGTQTIGAYTSGTYYTTLTYSLGLSEGNISGGIGAIVLGSDQVFDRELTPNPWGTWMWGFSPKVAKDNTKLATFVVRVAWARHTP